MATRKDIEAQVIDQFEELAGAVAPAAPHYRGLKSENRVAPSAWGLGPNQSFQFGDFRVELPDRTVVVETESAGGLTNLVKYWPLLPELAKPVALVHVFGLLSENDYLSHRLLWESIADRMRSGRFIAWLFTYDLNSGEDITDALAQFRRCLEAGWPDLRSRS